jgi:hypothetical protein
LGLSTSIRRATYDDAMQIAEVHVESWRTIYGAVIDQTFMRGLKCRRGSRARRRPGLCVL